MRLAVVSDLHANRPAWEAVWLDIQAVRADQILCLGDVIGYGPCPDEVLHQAHAHIHNLVLGNHEAALCGKLDESLFSENARRSLAWTRRCLSRQAVRFCSLFPLVLKGPGFRCLHSALPDPGRFDYLLNADQARMAWNTFAEPLLFFGHTHQPALFTLTPDGVIREEGVQDFRLEPGHRYMVNPGSVGLSRDGDPRAAWCLYDTDAHTIAFRRVPFDLDRFHRELEQAGLGGTLDWFFDQDPRKTVRPLRAISGFRPPASGQSGVREVVPEGELGTLRRKMTLWRTATVGLVTLLVLLGMALGVGIHVLRERSLDIPGTAWEPIARRQRAPGEPLVSLPPPAPPRAPLAGWHVTLGNRFRQSLEWGREETSSDEPILRIHSRDGRSDIRLISAPVPLDGLGVLTLEGEARKSPDFAGSLVFVVSLTRTDDKGRLERLDHFLVKEPHEARRDGWRLARQTVMLPSRSTEAQLEIRGRFTGTVDIRRLTLSGRPASKDSSP